MSAAHQSSNEMQTLRAQIAAAENKIQRYSEIIISQANEITELRNNLCEVPALRAQLAAAEKSYNDLIVSQADELTVLRNNLCGHCRTKSTPVATASARSLSAPLTTLNPDTSQPQHGSVTSPSPSRHFQMMTTKGLSNSFQTTLEGMRRRWARMKPQSQDVPEAFSAPDSNTASSGTLSHNQPSSIHSPVPDLLEQLDFAWSIAHNPSVKSVLRPSFLRSFSFEDAVRCLKFGPDGKYLAVGLADKAFGTANGKGFIYDVETGTRTSVLEEITETVKSGIRCICFSPNGESLAVGHHDGHINVWTIRENRIRNMFRGHTDAVTSVEFSPSGRHIISAAWDHTVRFWSMRDGSSRIFMDKVFTVRFNPDGHYFAAGYHDGSLVIWCLRSGKRMEKWIGHSDVISTVAFMPDGKGLMSGSCDKGIRYWDVDLPDLRRTGTKSEPLGLRPKDAPPEEKQAILEFDGHSSRVNFLAISPDGHWVLSGSNDKTARIWDARTGVHQCTLLGHTEWIRSVDFSAEGNYLAIGGLDGRVSLWTYGT